MDAKNNLYFTKSHEWIEFLEDDTAIVGITDYAQNSLGDLVFVGLPEEGMQVEVETSFAEVESVKAVSEIFSPVTGKIAQVNEELLDAPEKINLDPYGSWLVKMKDITDREQFLSREEYDEFCASEE